MYTQTTYHKTKFLDDPSILSRRQSRVLFTLGARADHFARAEDQRRRSGLSDTHNDGSKAFRIVFGVSGMKGDFLQVELTVQIYGGHNVSVGGTPDFSFYYIDS